MRDLDTKSIIDQLLASNTFRNKEVLKGLLSFLQQAYLDNKKIREIDIACGYFKRESSFVPGDDTIVRVNMYKLRQLLAKYYTAEGVKDDIKVTIPKGSYNLEFQSPIINSKEEKQSIIRFILSIILALSVIVNLVLVMTMSDKHKIDYHPVWQDYNNLDKPISIVLGNPFFFATIHNDSSRVICRNLQINLAEELTPDGGTSVVDYPYFSMNNVLPLPWIFQALNSTKDIELQALSDVNAEHIKSNNQIFIANINSFGFFSTFLDKTSFRISTNPRKIILQTEKDTTDFSVPEKNNGYHDDYAFFIKIPGPDNNIITMMGDFHSSGNAGIAGMLMDELKMKEFKKFVYTKYEHFPTYFEMLVKVSCFEQTELKTSIIYFNALEIEESGVMFFPEMMF